LHPLPRLHLGVRCPSFCQSDHLYASVRPKLNQE
jgi:hypothetical protein